MLRLRGVVVAITAIALLVPADTSSADSRVMMLNFTFAPNTIQPSLGARVTWYNEPNNRSDHNTVDSSALVLWQSPDLLGGEKYAYTFTSAGTYLYECTLHYFFGMLGTARVRPQVAPPDGPAGTIFTVTVATAEAPPDMVYDIQISQPGGPFRIWIGGTTLPTAEFDSTGRQTGTYRFRSRLRRVSDNEAIGFSPSVSISVTS